MKRLILINVVLMLFISESAFGYDRDAILGQWNTKDGLSIVDIYKCGELYCGKIIWLKYPKNKEGKDKVDINNPDETKRNSPLMGLDILWGFQSAGENRWEDGKIYDPDNGKTYSCKMTLEGDELKVRGFVGISLFGRTTVWTRKQLEVNK